MLYTGIHSHMMDRISNRHSDPDHCFAFCTSSAVAYELKAASLAGNTTALKTCLSNALSKTLPFGTTFGPVSALGLEKSLKKHTHIYAYIQT